MAHKINILPIVKDHLKTLSASKDWYFLMVPLILSITAMYFGHKLDKPMVDIINTSMSIFVGLFFNAILILFDIIKKENDPLKQKVFRQTLINICFLILTAIIAILFGYLSLNDRPVLILVSNFVVYFLLGLFFLTVLMVLKRVYLLLITEFDENVNKY